MSDRLESRDRPALVASSQGYKYPYRDDDRIYVTDAADRTMRALALTPSPAPEIPATTTPITVGTIRERRGRRQLRLRRQHRKQHGLEDRHHHQHRRWRSDPGRLVGDCSRGQSSGEPCLRRRLLRQQGLRDRHHYQHGCRHFRRPVPRLSTPMVERSHRRRGQPDGRRICVVTTDNNITAIDTDSSNLLSGPRRPARTWR